MPIAAQGIALAGATPAAALLRLAADSAELTSFNRVESEFPRDAPRSRVTRVGIIEIAFRK